MEWVEVRGKTVEVAVEAALEELGLAPDQAEVEVLQEPARGFLGIGGQDALVRVTRRRARRRRGKRSGERAAQVRGAQPRAGSRREQAEGRGGEQRRSQRRAAQAGERGAQPRAGSRRKEAEGRGREPRRGGARGERAGGKPAAEKDQPATPRRRGREPAEPARRAAVAEGAGERRVPEEGPPAEEAPNREEQGAVVREFLQGLLEAFGLEGAVEVRVEEDVIVAQVSGDQTEALVGVKGAILEAVHELVRTVVQRRTRGGVRIRLDIAGYTERRREALRIYAERLAGQVLQEGGEVMLEPMNAADRKVIHDAVVDIAGVSSYSEGEEPERAVVLAREEGGDEGDPSP